MKNCRIHGFREKTRPTSGFDQQTLPKYSKYLFPPEGTPVALQLLMSLQLLHFVNRKLKASKQNNMLSYHSLFIIMFSSIFIPALFIIMPLSFFYHYCFSTSPPVAEARLFFDIIYYITMVCQHETYYIVLFFSK